MMHRNHSFLAAALFAALTLAGAASGADTGGGLKERLDALVAADRAFCRAVRDEGLRAGFLGHLGVEAVVFQPGPVDGRTWYSRRQDLEGALVWAPDLAEISRSADLGYTSGPWEVRSRADDAQPSSSGHYVTIWSGQSDGSWRVLLDVGSLHAPHDRPVAAGREVIALGADAPAASNGVPAEADREAARAALQNADRAFSNLSAFKGMREALAQYAADDVRLHLRGQPPVQGKEASRAALPDRPAEVTWRPRVASVSAAGDLGFTWGTAQWKKDSRDPGDQYPYLRIWRRAPGGEWKVAIMMDDPVPLPPPRPGS